MRSSPALEIPTDLINRWRELQQIRTSKAAGRCDCQCGRCSGRRGRSAPMGQESATI